MNRISLSLAACALLLSACGSSGGGPSADDAEQRGLQFARCMRAHGVDMPDPKVGQGGNVQFRVTARGGKGGVVPAQMQKAMSACRKYAPNGGKPPSAAQQQEMRDAALKFSQCMRAHGVDIPDPQTVGGGVRIGGPSRGQGRDFNPASPRFQAAQKACQGVFPKGGGLSVSGGKGAGPSSESSP
jgi:hypothetical protein